MPHADLVQDFIRAVIVQEGIPLWSTSTSIFEHGRGIILINSLQNYKSKIAKILEVRRR